MTKRTNGNGKTFLLLFLFMAAFLGLIFIAQSVSQSTEVQQIVSEFGYVGVVIISIIAGLNAVVPIPAATFTPIFLAAGLSMPLIIMSMVIGTLIADFTGFFLGHLSRNVVEEKYPKTFRFFMELREKRSKWLIPVVIFYAAFVPAPNEVILIPLGLAGVRFQTLIIPLIIGNTINQLYLVYGVATLSQFLA